MTCCIHQCRKGMLKTNGPNINWGRLIVSSNLLERKMSSVVMIEMMLHDNIIYNTPTKIEKGNHWNISSTWFQRQIQGQVIQRSPSCGKIQKDLSRHHPGHGWFNRFPSFHCSIGNVWQYQMGIGNEKWGGRRWYQHLLMQFFIFCNCPRTNGRMQMLLMALIQPMLLMAKELAFLIGNRPTPAHCDWIYMVDVSLAASDK